MRIYYALAIAFSLTIRAQAPAQNPVELEQYLFVLSPDPPIPGGIHVVWVPEPILKLCLGKTAKQCASMDFCIRTTSKQVSTCQNLPIPLARLPKYPPDMTPRRQMSITYTKIVPSLSPVKGMDILVNFYQSNPPEAFARISMGARIKARVKLTRKPNDDDFDVLEFLPGR